MLLQPISTGFDVGPTKKQVKGTIGKMNQIEVAGFLCLYCYLNEIRLGLQAGGEAYSNWLFIAGDTRNLQREVDVFEQMARTAHTRGLQAACWNAVVVRCLTFGDASRAQMTLQIMDREELCSMAELKVPISSNINGFFQCFGIRRAIANRCCQSALRDCIC